MRLSQTAKECSTFDAPGRANSTLQLRDLVNDKDATIPTDPVPSGTADVYPRIYPSAHPAKLAM